MGLGLKIKMDTWNLRKKMTFFLTLAMLVTSMVIMLISTISAVYYMTNQSKEMAKSQLSTLVSNYDNTLEQYQNLAVALVIERSVQKYCKTPKLAGAEYEQEAGKVYNFLMNILNVRSNLNFVVVKKGNSGRYVYKGNSSVIDARFDIAYQSDLKESLPVKEGSTVRISFGNQYFRNGEYTLTLYHPIYSTSSIHESNGMLIMNFSDSMIGQIHIEEFEKIYPKLFMIDCNGRIVSVYNEEQIGKKVSYASQISGSSGSFKKAEH